ncbi:Zinc finger CCHC-type protein [Dioscorea alata]|uniref:Zinc finger CCHC-type protein n=1 Tax=Dioscorea alata TaxID=55571 RepID=A0ACB7V5V4_DIOAL|nr:Zinc finger CCHC-type protein [Dioscorea alata]
MYAHLGIMLRVLKLQRLRMRKRDWIITLHPKILLKLHRLQCLPLFLKRPRLVVIRSLGLKMFLVGLYLQKRNFRMETGVPVRIKPFGVEIRNVRCVRCGTFGHQSGDRECPLKDAIMPNEESRLKRDDPLTTIMAQTDSSEPLKWELKQRPGMSPPRGGFGPDDPNQQIIADDIFDEYGGFLNGSGIPALLSNFSASKPRKHLKHKGRTRSKHQSSTILGAQSNKAQHDKHLSSLSSSSDSDTCKKRKLKGKHRKHKRQRSESSLSQSSDSDSYSRRHHHRVHHRHQHRH